MHCFSIFYIHFDFFLFPKMTVWLVMNAVRTHWSHGNECDLAADIGTRIASSVS
jgi:hypothetical protein